MTNPAATVPQQPVQPPPQLRTSDLGGEPYQRERDDKVSRTTDSSYYSPSSNGQVGTPKNDLSGSGILDPSDPDIAAKIEHKRQEHERQRAAQRQVFEQQMALLEKQQREEEQNLYQHQNQQNSPVGQIGENRGRTHVFGQQLAASAPTTPPELKDPTAVRALNSSSPTVDSPGDSLPEEGLNGSNVPGLHLPTSPAGSRSASKTRSASNGATIDSNSDLQRQQPVQDLGSAFDRMGLGTRGIGQLRETVLQRNTSNNSLHRKADGSSPGVGDSLTPVLSERFLFDDELDAEDSAFVKKYNLQEDPERFPVLLRNDTFPGMQLSASSAALDLAPLSQAPPRFSRNNLADSKGSEWPQFSAHDTQQQQQSHPPSSQSGADKGSTDLFGDRRGRSERSSPRLGGMRGTGDLHQPPYALQQLNQHGRASPNSSSSPLGASTRNNAPGTPANVIDGQRSASARFPSAVDSQRYGAQGPFSGPNKNGLAIPDSHGSLGQPAPFRSGSVPESNTEGTFPGFAMGAFGRSGGLDPTGPFTNYSPAPFDGQGPPHSRPNSGYFEAFSANAASPQHAMFGSGPNNQYRVGLNSADSSLAAAAAAAAAASKSAIVRKGELDVTTRLEELQGEIFGLCKDQHGCRYLQKKLEEGLPAHRDMIFAETFQHFADLMTDPFGNYLCQKMLEYCTDDQRDLIVESVSSELVTISLNMHGTRAVQKTIDFLSTPRQIRSIIHSLTMSVVTLIKDLNGNHVIQKCLNRLGPEDNQFIYNAVAAHCVEVATHRHGCCVLQRCIDHASDSQRVQLVTEITFNALTLVQDPFGNYVVQYVLDLNDARFSDAVIRQFVGNVCLLSVQKFSSNVIEKCIRVSEANTRKQLIDELLNRSRLEKLLRDSFANYVVQTSLDYADPMQRMQLVECIRPILPVIRNTPYGKRIQSKLQRDNLDLGPQQNPYAFLQAHHQLQAIAAMASRQAPEFGQGPYNPAPANPYGHQPAMHGMPGVNGGPPRPGMQSGPTQQQLYAAATLAALQQQQSQHQHQNQPRHSQHPPPLPHPNMSQGVHRPMQGPPPPHHGGHGGVGGPGPSYPLQGYRNNGFGTPTGMGGPPPLGMHGGHNLNANAGYGHY